MSESIRAGAHEKNGLTLSQPFDKVALVRWPLGDGQRGSWADDSPFAWDKGSRTDAEGRYYRLPSAGCVPLLDDYFRRDATIAQDYLTYIGPGSAARMNATHRGRSSFPVRLGMD